MIKVLTIQSPPILFRIWTIIKTSIILILLLYNYTYTSIYLLVVVTVLQSRPHKDRHNYIVICVTGKVLNMYVTLNDWTPTPDLLSNQRYAFNLIW